MNQFEQDIILRRIEDCRQRIDSFYNLMKKSENGLGKRIDACYKSIWKVYRLLEEMKK